MKFEEIQARVGHVPFITKGNAEYLYDLIVGQKLSRVLELGIAHGTATCYMAAALEEIGGGRITSVDLLQAANTFRPSVEEQLAKTGLSRFVEIVRMQTGYTWFLHDNILKNTDSGICQEEYDLCLIDGPKNWTIDGAAFFFVDKLLKPGGRIIFDDYLWTYAEAGTHRNATDGITHRLLSQIELETPQIREVFELLVVQHPSYSNFVVLRESSWAIAQKISSSTKSYRIVRRYEESYKDIITKGIRKVQRLIHGG
jgi:predicted O-methyltransferase YrrM